MRKPSPISINPGPAGAAEAARDDPDGGETVKWVSIASDDWNFVRGDGTGFIPFGTNYHDQDAGTGLPWRQADHAV